MNQNMGTYFFILGTSFFVLFIINLVWLGLNIFSWSVDGVESYLNARIIAIEDLYYSMYIKWILFFDFIWILCFLAFLFKRKNFMTDSSLHYLSFNKIENPSVCVIIPVYNEEKSITKIVNEIKEQKFVSSVLVIDNHSSDNSASLAKACGATVITKDKNMGYAHSWWLGFSEAVKQDANIIAFFDSDDTYNAYDLQKMIPYLDNCDMVIGNRLVQALSQKGNQNNIFLSWGNAFIAKLFQIKYINFRHLGFVHLNDAGCTFRLFRKESLRKIIDGFKDPKTGNLAFGCNYITVGMFTTAKAIEKNLKIVEIPVTFKKRTGKSKTCASKLSNALYYGFYMIWYILKS